MFKSPFQQREGPVTSGGLSPVLRGWDVCRQTLHLPSGCGARDQGREEEARHPRPPRIRRQGVPAQGTLSKAVNEHSRSFTVPGEGQRSGGLVMVFFLLLPIKASYYLCK